MLGVNRNPRLGRADDVLREVAVDLGVPETFHPTDVGVFFNAGNEGTEVADPYFGGAGPTRPGCQHCARCLTGCPVNANNTTAQNYPNLAEGLRSKVHDIHTATTYPPARHR